ncbi:GntR family transcriptional regulator [Micromonospora sp. PTRAS2]
MPTPHYGQPRYRTIADELRQRIESGIIPPGSLLPAESALTAEFRASRGTIRQAIAALREAGLAATEHGRGTYAVAASLGDGSHVEVRRQQVPADGRLSLLFNLEEGAMLVEHEEVKRRGDYVESVVRTYRRST